MGLISPGRENLLDFLEVRQVLSTYNGDLRDRSEEHTSELQSRHIISGTSKRCFTPWLQLKMFTDIPSPLERKHESPAHIQRSPVSAS